MIIGKEDPRQENKRNIMEITNIWFRWNIYDKNVSDILEEEHCWRKLVQETGGGEIITERKYPREKYIWGENVYGKFICKGKTRNEQILLDRENILMEIFYMSHYSRR